MTNEKPSLKMDDNIEVNKAKNRHISNNVMTLINNYYRVTLL